MNAYELALKMEESELQYKEAGDYYILQDAANMLRRQHDEIVKLKLEWQVWFDMTAALKDRIAFLESQVHGGTTK